MKLLADKYGTLLVDIEKTNKELVMKKKDLSKTRKDLREVRKTLKDVEEYFVNLVNYADKIKD